MPPNLSTIMRLDDARPSHVYRAEQLEFERDALKNELAYQKEADQKVLAEECAAGEKHCTCAPALYRRIAELEAAFDDAVRALWENDNEAE